MLGRIPAVALVMSIVLAGCGEGSGGGDTEVVVRDSAGVRITEYPAGAVAAAPRFEVGEPLLRLGGLDEPAERDMTGVESARLLDDDVVVANPGTVTLQRFDRGGAIVATGAGHGGGPGELDQMGRLVPAATGVAVLDFFRGRLVRYDTALAFAESRVLSRLPGGIRYGVFFVAADGSLYSVGGIDERPAPAPDGEILRRPQVVERIAGEAGPVDTLFTVAGGEFYFLDFLAGGMRRRRFGMQPLVHRLGAGLVSGDGELWELVHRDTTGAVRGIVRLDHPRRAVTEEMRAEQLRMDHVEIDALPAGGFRGIRRMAAIDFADPKFPDSLPPWDASRVGADGTLWLREAMAPTDSTQRWLVFSHDSLLATATLPAAVTLLDARRDRLLLARRDSLDIGHLELRPLRLP